MQSVCLQSCLTWYTVIYGYILPTAQVANLLRRFHRATAHLNTLIRASQVHYISAILQFPSHMLVRTVSPERLPQKLLPLVCGAYASVKSYQCTAGGFSVPNQTFIYVNGQTGTQGGPGLMGMGWAANTVTNSTPWWMNAIDQFENPEFSFLLVQ